MSSEDPLIEVDSTIGQLLINDGMFVPGSMMDDNPSELEDHILEASSPPPDSGYFLNSWQDLFDRQLNLRWRPDDRDQ